MRKVLLFCLSLCISLALFAQKPDAATSGADKAQAGSPADSLDSSLERAFFPRLYLGGYNPIINNRIELYKIDKGHNIHRAKPFEITAFAPEHKEKVDFANHRVIISIQTGEFKLSPDVTISFDHYFSNLRSKVFRKSLLNNIKTQTQTAQSTSSGFIKDISVLPDIAIPKAVQKLIGSTAGRLNLDGTQKLTLSVSNTSRKQVPIYDTSGKNVFDMKMETETNLRLSGTIGEKIAINFKYNSKQDDQIFDANNVNVKYTGVDDEFTKSIEGGNITLSLGGSRYISYSASSQGLFGITSKFKYGDLDLSVIASKEESQKNVQSFVGKSQADSSIVSSWKYARRTMYFLDDPYELYELYGPADSASVPKGWVNNAIKTYPDGTWRVKTNRLPKSGTVEVWFDDANSTNDNETTEGDSVYWAGGYPQTYFPKYDRLAEGTDYITDYANGTIILLRNIERNGTLGVRFERQDGIQVPLQTGSSRLQVRVLRKRYQEYSPYNPNELTPSQDLLNSWHYQMRNIYDMGRTNIKSDGFELQVYTQNVDLTRNYNLPNEVATQNVVTYNDYLRLNANNSEDGIINGDDATVNLTKGWIIIPFIEPFLALGDGIIYRKETEDEYSYQDSTDIFIGIKGKIGRDAIELSSAGVLRGSVKVKVNGTEQRENVDYIVDYDFGRLTFLTPAGKDPEAKIEVEFESRTLFSVAQKNLAGVRAEYKPSDNLKLGGTLIYRSEFVADKRPRIGNENIEMLMGNVDAELKVKPFFVTKVIDALPLIKTSSPTELSLSGEMAFTLPNIYGNPDGKKKEAYIDDMEAIMDSYPLGVTYSNWVLGSKPYDINLAKGRMNWYNAKDVKRIDIEPDSLLTDREKNEYVTVLTLKATPNPVFIPGAETQSWAGVMKYLGNQLDFSQKKYLELLVQLDHKENNATEYPNVTLHLDLGDISEDFYTEYGGYGIKNTEDRNSDGELTIAEDIGLDGISKNDPGHDPLDIAAPPDGDDYSKVNGTEENRILDTEDLDGNGILNTLNRYLSYSFSLLNPDPEVVVDSLKKNWKLIRIPLNDPRFYTVVNDMPSSAMPSLQKVSYARIWLETNSPDPVKVRIADISLVGNKWQDNYIRDFSWKTGTTPDYPSTVNNHNLIIKPSVLALTGTTYLTGIVSNQKNSHYNSPDGTWYMEDKKVSAESALSVELTKLQPGQMVLLRQRLQDQFDLRSYGKLRFWVYPESAPNSTTNPDSVFIIFRIGADSLNYYQVRQRVKVNPYSQNRSSDRMRAENWQQLEIDLQELVAVKELNPSQAYDHADSLIYYLDNDQPDYSKGFYKRGNPLLNNIRDLNLGVFIPNRYYTRPADEKPFTGTVYFNDIRVADPYEDIGVAKRLSLNASFADVATLNVDFEDKSENFNTNIQRGRTNTFTSTRSLNITNKYYVNKLFPASWNLDIPISLAYVNTEGTPRFKANSDLLRENILNDSLRAVEQSKRVSYSADFGFSQKIPPKNKILLYTIKNISVSGRVESSKNETPTARDNILAYRGTLNYNLNLPAEKTSLKLYKSYRMGYFPHNWSNSFTFSANEPQSWDRATNTTYLLWNRRTQTTDTRTLTSDNSLSWNILSDLSATARLNTNRDLKQRDSLWVVNIGKLTTYTQDLGLNYNPNYFPRVMNFTSSVAARYSDTQRKYSQLEDGQYVDYYQRDGNTNRTIRLNLTLQNSTLLGSWVQSLKAKTPAPKEEPKQEETKEEPKPKDGMVEPLPKEDKDINPPKSEPSDDIKRSDEEMKIREAANKKLMELQDQLSPEELEKLEQELLSQLENFEEPKAEVQIPSDGLKEPAVSDSGKAVSKPKKPRGNPVVGFLSLLSRFKNITASYQNGYTMNYARKNDAYPFAFQIGLPHDLVKDSLEAISDDNTLTLSSGIAISRRLDSVINYSYTNNMRESTASNQTLGWTFPDITLTLSDLESLLGIQKFITGSRLNSGFQYSYRETGNPDQITANKQETFTTGMNPVLGFTGNILGKVSTNLSYAISRSKNITAMVDRNIIKTTDSQSMNGNLSYSFRAGRGFTIPFTQKKIHIKNELTSSLGITYEKNYDETQGNTVLVDRSTSRLTFSPQATYQFDTNIKGGLTSSYEMNADKKRDDGTSIFRLGVWVEVNL
ncbi:hypothetical protein MASR1M36_08590 [Candidatus Cloacimonadaceae bacterium]